MNAPVEHSMDEETLAARIRAAVTHLSKVEADVVRARYGIDQEEKTLPEIAATQGISLRNLSRVLSVAVKKLARFAVPGTYLTVHSNPANPHDDEDGLSGTLRGTRLSLTKLADDVQ